MIEKMIDEYYEKYKGLPSDGCIVRNGQKDDAFELVALKILYGKLLGLSFEAGDIGEIAKYVIAPPDSSIDIFIEHGNEDDASFDVIQVKNAALSETELRDCISKMERTISDYCRSPLHVKSLSCREKLSISSLDKGNKKKCQYFVVHRGDARDFVGSKENEHVINAVDLEVIAKSDRDKVEHDTLPLSGVNEYMRFGGSEDDQNAIVCSLNGYQLALLSNKYYSTEIGRNILFGHNLRESLSPKTSKSYKGMVDTVRNSPENFWYFNNGITIVAEGVSLVADEEGEAVAVDLRQFSIVNGAQTTSSLGLMLKGALRDDDIALIESLKRTYVIARILKTGNPETENAIAICNNTQNPITSRDMVTNNAEQKALYHRLIDETYPQIFMETRRGSKPPQTFNKLFVHRKTTNESLAQLAYAGFYLELFTAKDKKAALFSNDYSQNDYTLNAIYHKVFHLDAEDNAKSGILFRKSKAEIDELLFVQQLYKEGKRYLKRVVQGRIEGNLEKLEAAETDKKPAIQDRINVDSSTLETIGVCMFYYVTTYYEYAEQFGDDWSKKRFDVEKFYQDKVYREALVKDTADFFLTGTAKLLVSTAKENGKAGNINNWVRSHTCQEKYLAALRDQISYNPDLQEKYEDLMGKHKIVPL